MQSQILSNWWRTHRKALLCGFVAGVLWGGLTAASVTPREWLVYDELAGVVYKFREAAASPIAVSAEGFFNEYYSTLIQVTLTFLFFVSLAGWATWQLTRLRPRGADQPPLREGMDWYLIGLAMGGLILVWLFRALGLAAWFKGYTLTPLKVGLILLGILLPLYTAVSLFLVWFFRLKSVRAPDWETHYPKPSKRPWDFSWLKSFRRKGGDS